METAESRDQAGKGHVVMAEVVHGPEAEVKIGDGVFCSPECARADVFELTRSLSADGKGTAFILQQHGRPIAYVVASDGRTWMVQVYALDELLVEG